MLLKDDVRGHATGLRRDNAILATPARRCPPLWSSGKARKDEWRCRERPHGRRSPAGSTPRVRHTSLPRSLSFPVAIPRIVGIGIAAREEEGCRVAPCLPCGSGRHLGGEDV